MWFASVLVIISLLNPAPSFPGGIKLQDLVFVGPEGGEIKDVVCDPSGGRLFAQSYSDLYVRFSGDPAWRRVEPFSNLISFEEFIRDFSSGLIITSSGYIYVINDTVFYSPDLITWTPQRSFENIECFSKEDGADIIYLVERSYTEDAFKVWKTTDGGLNWVNISSLPTSSFYSARLITFAPSNSQIVYLLLGDINGGYDIYYSVDGGANWIFLQNLNVSDIYDMKVNPSNENESFIATFSGLYYATSTTGPWDVNTSALAAGIYIPLDVEFKRRDTIYVSTIFKRGIFKGVRSSITPNLWLFTRIYDQGVVTDIELYDQGIICASFGKGVLVKHITSPSFVEFNDSLSAHVLFGSGRAWNGVYTFVNFGGRVFKTSDGGNTWQALKDFYFMGQTTEVSPADQNFIMVAALDINENHFKGYYLFRTLDGGATWQVCDSSELQNIPTIESINILSADSIVLVLGYFIQDTLSSYMIKRSTSKGYNLTTVLNNLESPSNMAGIDLVALCNNGNILISTDSGASFTITGHSVPPSYDIKVAYNPAQRAFYIGTPYGQLWRYDPITSSFEIIIDIPEGITDVDVDINGRIYILSSSGLWYSVTGTDFSNIPLPPLPFVGIRAVLPNTVLLYSAGRGFYRLSEINIKDITLSNLKIKYMHGKKLLIEGNNLDKATIRVFDATGREVPTDITENIKGKLVNITNKRAGVYILKISTGEESVTKKVVVW
ncbi:MAG: T9SS type A sorting domain-containing protein [Candidatus Hydrothermia bacterium]